MGSNNEETEVADQDETVQKFFLDVLQMTVAQQTDTAVVAMTFDDDYVVDFEISVTDVRAMDAQE
mgnify:CR=1 FL=1